MRRARSATRPLGASLVLAALLAAGTAAAGTPQERALAEALFREGKALVAAGQVKDACPKFAESQRLDPALGTLIYLATCHEEEGKTATAWLEFSEAASQAKRARQPDRERLAQTRARALEAKLSRIAIRTSEANVTIVLDGVKLGAQATETPLPVDPGEHTIEATAPGKLPFSKRVTAAAGPATETVVIPELAVAPRTEAPPPPPIAEPAPAPPPPPRSGEAESPAGQTHRTVGFVVGGAGLVFLGVGAAFGLRAAGLADDADAHCQGRFCTPEGLDGHDRADTSATLSTVAFSVGVVALAAAAYLVLTAPPSGPRRSGLR